MNWVGGSRNRFMMKNDVKKQREFFEKRKMQQKLKNLGIPLPGSSSGSMDLVTLFIVNQIATKKENKDPPKVALLSDCKGGSKPRRSEPLVLPMSPCSPSRLSLVEGQPHYSVQGMRKRKHCIPQGFKCQQLSPVLESAFSDNSASDYLPPVADPLSPFASTSSASSGPGIFPLQPNLQQRGQMQAQPPPNCSPPPWDTSGTEQAKFRPFSQPRGMRDCSPWSSGSNTPLYQPETPTVARVLFGSPEPDNTEARQHARHKVMFCLNQPEDKEPMLCFTLNQSETEEQFEEQVFRGFSNEDYRSEASHFGRAKSKIYLKEETPIRPSRTQNAPDSQRRGSETNSLTQLSDCTDMDSSCAGLNNGPLVCCELSPSYSSRGGYFSSDSDDDEDGCQSCLHSGSSCMDKACSAEALNPNQGSQGNQKQGHSQPGPLPRQTKPKVNFRDDQRAAENMACNDETCGNSDKHIGSSTAQFLPPSQRSEIHKRKMTSSETRDAATQTADIPVRQTSDASTQCSLVPDRPTDPPEFNLYKTPVDVSVQNPATGRQTGCRDAAAEQNTQRASSDGYRRGGEHPPWSKLRKERRAGQLSISGIINKYPTLNTDSRVMIQKPTNRFLEALHMTDGREMSRQDGGGRDERAKQDLVENGPLMKDLPEEEREEVASAGRVNRLSEEAETLQEIADILLMLKQRKKEG